MKLMKKLTPVALATTMALGGLTVPTIASAELSANLGISNMYFWRGLNLTPDGPQVHGGLQYDHDSGGYGGIWVTNETGGHETDLYFGYGGEAGGFSYDVSYWLYLYPENDAPNTDLLDNEVSELIVALGYGPATLTVYNDQGSENMYITLGAEFGDYSVTYGVWDLEDAAGNEYSHLTLGYSVTDDFSIGVSVASNDVADNIPGGDPLAGQSVETDPLFFINYNIPIEL